MPNILVIPIDNRPVCYDLPEITAQICADANVFLPPREYLGGLTTYADYDKIFKWCEKTLSENHIDFAVLALDTIAYGGLVASRRVELSKDIVEKRLLDFLKMLRTNDAKILATSSIMRISNNNVNEEEKEYWNKYGEMIFRYSFESHKTGVAPQNQIPPEVLADYLATRKRNFEVNKFVLELLEEKMFDFLVVSQDDTAQFGLNVHEGQLLGQIIKEENLPATIKTGADEIPLTLMTRGFLDFYGESVSISPIFSYPESKNIISRYEDVTIEKSFEGQVSICGAKVTQDGDFSLYINTPCQIQDDLAMQIFNDGVGAEFVRPKGFFAIADVKLANGSDNPLVEKLLAEPLGDFLGYAAWNTTANTLGCVLSASIFAYVSKKLGLFNLEAFKKFVAVRLLDEWAYQANLRQLLRQNPDFDIEAGYVDFLKRVSAFLDLEFEKFSFYFPWDRTFEVGVFLE